MHGFLNVSSFIDAAGRYLPKALWRASFLQDGWRPQQFIAPQDPAESIEGYGAQYTQQLTLRPGSYLVGLQAAAITGTIGNFAVQIRFDFDGKTLFSHPINAALLRGTGNIKQIILPEPRPILGDGVVSVIIQNNATSTGHLQVILRVAEPQ